MFAVHIKVLSGLHVTRGSDVFSWYPKKLSQNRVDNSNCCFDLDSRQRVRQAHHDLGLGREIDWTDQLEEREEVQQRGGRGVWVWNLQRKSFRFFCEFLEIGAKSY